MIISRFVDASVSDWASKADRHAASELLKQWS